jgi:hypothetical protein
VRRDYQRGAIDAEDWAEQRPQLISEREAAALVNNTAGSSNLALGSGAGRNLTTGSDNIEVASAGKAGEAKTIRVGTAKSRLAPSSPGSVERR